MTETVYYIISAVLVLGVLIGISMMSKVKSANNGNTISAICTLIAILVVMYNCEILTAWQAWLGLAIGAVIGIIGAVKVKMIEMPQAVALLNGFGGLASALVAILTIWQTEEMFVIYVGAVALVVGFVTFTGSVVAAGKLHKLLPQKPVVWKAHSFIVAITIIATVLAVVLCPDCIWLISVLSAFFGVAFAIRVGGADMPITISLLNSLSGVAGGIAGIAVGDVLLVAIGGVVGASGLLLTQIMCRAMNRSLVSILVGGKVKKSAATQETTEVIKEETVKAEINPGEILSNAKKVIIVPGYGMALGQAQSIVKTFADKLESNGAEVKYAIHPVAGRMPGHMNVLLCEVDVPYDKLYEMDAINEEFKETDVAIIIGANDVVNPAANTAEGTPIYGMPVLNASDAKHVIVCNFDDKPGYAGVPNPLYQAENTIMMLGDAKETVTTLTSTIGNAPSETKEETNVTDILKDAKKVIIVPGYGMALGQAQSIVKSFADKLESNGAEVKYAIHPVAGRMPGHMNVLLCEVDVPYDKLYEMDAINDEFKETDVAVIIGANDVVNPAANTAEGTPIYGMPVLNASDAKHVIVCNFDDKPGYAGVPNPLYQAENTIMMLGDAKETVASLMAF
ncbi:MAG: NAD(P)(+) transhydrogenase (Re/Si-specific) subunit beta [Clostridia bacterium]|nr:NAD(P)(+) transhydrogenase (Re/Si-specific) subunit beta [Clostridia bacterium]